MVTPPQPEDQIVTLRTLHQEMQEVKKYMYTSKVLLDSVVRTDQELDEQDARISKLESRVASFYVFQGILVSVLTAILVDWFLTK